MPDPTPYDGDFGESDQEPTHQEMVSAPTAAFLRELREIREAVKRQGEAVASLAIAVTKQTAELARLSDRLEDPIKRKGRDR